MNRVFDYLMTLLTLYMWVPVITAWSVLGCGWRRRPTCMEGSYECTE